MPGIWKDYNRNQNSQREDRGCEHQSPLLPKDKELLVRQKLADRLHRGTIDFFVTFEANAVSSAKHINADLAESYFRQISELGDRLGLKADSALYLNSIIRFPDVIDNTRQDVITAENWAAVEAAIDEAISNTCDYRRARVSLSIRMLPAESRIS